jgi:hypothetical protein
MRLGPILTSTDYFRRSPARAGAGRGHKEWLHFCLHHADIDVLINFSVNDEIESSSSVPGKERAHVIALVRQGDRWLGDVDRYWESDIDIAGGEVAARFGECRLELRESAFHVSARLRDVPLEIELELAPETFPSFSNNIHLSRDHSLSWLAVPRLRASGTVRCSGSTWHVTGAMAYHDHNWGHFAWGADFAWEWGYGAPLDSSCPWSFLFVRLSDRAMTSTQTQALTLWRGSDIVRSFRGRDLRVSASGFLAAERVFKFPAVMALLSPGTATEVPRTLTILVDADGDVLEIVMEARSVAQIIVPNDRGAGVTIVNEVAATLRVSGRVLDQSIDYHGRGMFEVLAA